MVHHNRKEICGGSPSGIFMYITMVQHKYFPGNIKWKYILSSSGETSLVINLSLVVEHLHQIIFGGSGGDTDYNGNRRVLNTNLTGLFSQF